MACLLERTREWKNRPRRPSSKSKYWLARGSNSKLRIARRKQRGQGLVRKLKKGRNRLSGWLKYQKALRPNTIGLLKSLKSRRGLWSNRFRRRISNWEARSCNRTRKPSHLKGASTKNRGRSSVSRKRWLSWISNSLFRSKSYIKLQRRSMIKTT